MTTSLPRDLYDAVLPLARAVAARRSMSPGKFGVLRHLDATGRATTGDAAAAIQVSPQAISLAAKELEAMGLVERTQDSDDRRKVWLVLTARGREALQHELSSGVAWLATHLEPLTDDERRRLEDALPVLARLAAEATRG